MRRSYLLIYSDKMGSRDQLKRCLNRMEMVKTWRYDMPNMFYIISENSAKDIAKQIRTLTGEEGGFLVAELTGNCDGWLFEESWDFINNKSPKPKK